MRTEEKYGSRGRCQPILMDFREKRSNIGRILAERYGITVIEQSLIAGDYVIGGTIAIERKTSSDFIRSLIDGRLFTQAAKMRRYFRSAALIVEGGDLLKASVDIHPHAVQGALISLGLRWQIPCFFSEHDEDSALLLRLIAYQASGIAQQSPYRPGRKPNSSCKRQLYILEGLPRVGPRLAHELLRYFGNVEAVIAASEEELIQVPRIGKGIAKKMREAALTSYR